MDNRIQIFRLWLTLGLVVVLSFQVANAVEVGQTDDFEDGTEQNWIWGREGFGGPVAVLIEPSVSTYLETESFGGDDAPGSRMAILNREQWTGDYRAAGINSIRLDAVNDGPNFAFEDVVVRIAFSSSTATTGSGRVVSEEGYLLSRGDGWQALEFDLTKLAPIAGSSVPEVMSSVSEMRIISAAEPDFIGDQIIARLGVDNISAVNVPEPAMWPFGCVAITFVIRHERRKRCRARIA